MADDADISEAMREIARRRWAKATEAEKLAQGRLMVKGRAKARRRRKASESKAKRS